MVNCIILFLMEVEHLLLFSIDLGDCSVKSLEKFSIATYVWLQLFQRTFSVLVISLSELSASVLLWVAVSMIRKTLLGIPASSVIPPPSSPNFLLVQLVTIISRWIIHEFHNTMFFLSTLTITLGKVSIKYISIHWLMTTNDYKFKQYFYLNWLIWLHELMWIKILH